MHTTTITLTIRIDSDGQVSLNGSPQYGRDGDPPPEGANQTQGTNGDIRPGEEGMPNYTKPT